MLFLQLPSRFSDKLLQGLVCEGLRDTHLNGK